MDLPNLQTDDQLLWWLKNSVGRVKRVYNDLREAKSQCKKNPKDEYARNNYEAVLAELSKGASKPATDGRFKTSQVTRVHKRRFLSYSVFTTMATAAWSPRTQRSWLAGVQGRQ